MGKVVRAVAVGVMLLLVACGERKPIESVESLVANPERIKELRGQCRADRSKIGEAQCHAVAEAWRQRFMRVAPSPYSDDSAPQPSSPNEQGGSK